MTNILQVLLGLVLVNYLLFDVLAVETKSTVSTMQLSRAFMIARTTAIAFLVALVCSALLETFVLSRFPSKILSILFFIVILTAAIHVIALVYARRQHQFAPVPAIFLPLLFVNCVVLGISMPPGNNGLQLNDVFVAGVARCAGFALLLMLFTALRERLAGATIPAPFRVAPATLVTAALLSMTFMGFAGLT